MKAKGDLEGQKKKEKKMNDDNFSKVTVGKGCTKKIAKGEGKKRN